MGRTLRSNVVQTDVRSPAKRKHTTARENKVLTTKETGVTHDRNVLVDQTNTTPSPPKKARLRARKADADDIVSSVTPTGKSQASTSQSCQEITKETSVRARRGAKVEVKHSAEERNGPKKQKADSVSDMKTQISRNNTEKPTKTVNSTTDACKVQKTKTKNIDDVPQASSRCKRTLSLKENETKPANAEKKETSDVKNRTCRISKEEILRAINESSDEDTPIKETNTHSKSAAYKLHAFNNKKLTASEDAKKKIVTPSKSVSVSEKAQGPKGCVYKSNEDSEPLAIKKRSENERLALYEFEFDSTEEPKPKKKRKVQRAKPKQAGKTKPKTSGKNFKKTEILHKAPKPALTTALIAVKPVVAAAPSQIKIATNKVLPSKLIIKAGTEVPLKQVKPAMVQKSIKTVYSPRTEPKVSVQSKLLTPPKSSPASSVSTPDLDLPPLINLFDDDIIATSPTKASTASPRSSRRLTNALQKPAGPIRFEYEDIIKARERVTRNTLTPSASPVVKKIDTIVPKKAGTPSIQQDSAEEDNTLPAADSSVEFTPRLKQTSIRSFLNVKNDEDIERIDDIGLFSTGSRSAVEGLPTKVKAVKVNTVNNRMMSSTPQRPGMSRPPMETFLSPVMGSPVSRLSPSKTRTSPRKVMETPEKSVKSPINEVVRRSPRKLLDSPKKDSPLPLPTRLSIGTLRAVMRTNAAVAHPVRVVTSDEFPSLEETKNPPASPTRNFNKPARKSYERRPRKIPQFMELEEEDSEDDVEDDNNDMLFGDMKAGEAAEETTRHPLAKHHRKQKGQNVEENNKELDDWASRFNSQLEDVENFELNVE